MKKCYVLILCLFLGLPVVGQPVIPMGDANRDGAANIIDALMIAQYSVGVINSYVFLNAADVDQNDQVDIVDALMIAQWYTGLIDEMPGALIYRKYQEALDRAREGWNNLLIEDYRYELSHFCFFCMDSGDVYDLKVSQSPDIEVTEEIVNTTTGVPVPEADFPQYPTVRGLFDILQSAIDGKFIISGLEYDPLYFYPRHMALNPDLMIYDEERAFSAGNLRVGSGESGDL